MDKILTAEYFQLDEDMDVVECRVTFIDGSIKTFFKEDDLIEVMWQLRRQSNQFLDQD